MTAIGPIELGPAAPHHLIQTEQRMMDVALRSSLSIHPDLREAVIRRLRSALTEIANRDVTEIALDPAWPRRVAIHALEGLS